MARVNKKDKDIEKEKNKKKITKKNIKEDKKQIALYAYHLEFIHPTTKQELIFEKLPPKIDHWTEFTVSKYVH